MLPEPTFVDVIRGYADERGQQVAAIFLERGERVGGRISYAELDLAARTIAGALVDAGFAGKPVLLDVPESLDFLRCFLGCLYAGSFAVPVPSVRQRRMQLRVRSILVDARPACLLASGAEVETFRREFDSPLPCLSVAEALSAGVSSRNSWSSEEFAWTRSTCS